jgi:branched-chain amino acid transport system substrate-binding protein
MRRLRTLWAVVAAGLAPLTCDDQAAQPDNAIPVGVLLSYSGPLAANSVNSERALMMALEAVNRAGGVGGRPLALVARDTGSDPRLVPQPAGELVDAGAAVLIGPDTIELGVALKSLLAEHTVIMPSYATADSSIYKPHPWFVMGAPATRIACELVGQLRADARQRPLVIRDTNGYNVQLGFQLNARFGLPTLVLPADDLPDQSTVSAIVAAAPDALVLATLPSTASALVYTLAAAGPRDPFGWYLGPTLHTPALLDTIPIGSLEGARGVATGTVATASAFRSQFAARWQDQPLDDAYPFYDAAAIAALALQRALVHDGAIPTGDRLGPHIQAVTRAGGQAVQWNQLDRGLTLLADGQEVAYQGLSGLLEFDATGQTLKATTNWWTIGPEGFLDVESLSDCR